MSIFVKLPVLLSISLVSLSSISAQDTKESVILYNSLPVRVELSEVGKILSFYGLASGYMDGYDLGKADTSPTVETIVSDVDPTFDNTSQNAEYAIISQERVVIDFQEGFATLSGAAVADLSAVAAKVKSGEIVKVVLAAYKQSSEPDKLIQNRLDSIVTFLNLKGVSGKQIITEIQASASLANSVTINFVS